MKELNIVVWHQTDMEAAKTTKFRRLPMASRDDNFDVNEFFANIGQGRKSLRVRKKQRIYAQGEPCDALFYIQKGKVKLTVVSRAGKEATLGILNAGAFFGEGSLAGQPRRMGSADAMEDCELMRIEKHVIGPTTLSCGSASEDCAGGLITWSRAIELDARARY